MTSEWRAEEVVAELRGLVAGPESVSGAVAEIIERVRREGDAGVAHFTEQFDSPGQPAPPCFPGCQSAVT